MLSGRFYKLSAYDVLVHGLTNLMGVVYGVAILEYIHVHAELL